MEPRPDIQAMRLAWSVDEAAQLIGISLRKMRDLVRYEEVRSVMIGGRRLIRHVDLVQYLDDLAAEAAA